MIALLGDGIDGGRVFTFGFTDVDLNRIEFNKEPILIDFGFAGCPDLFGFIHYFPEFAEAEEIDLAIVAQSTKAILSTNPNVTIDRLYVFPFARNAMEKFRNTPFFGFPTQVPITHPKDQQFFFAGSTEQAIESHLAQHGLIAPNTPRTKQGRGFGSRN
jgi:hypothetical protein